jgi:CDGSH-type Zn-finger protein
MSENELPSIECAPDGPYVIKGLKDLRNGTGSLPAKPAIALCRCGGSANKPFCDGTHAKNGFSGAKHADPSRDKRDDYRGRRITIHDNRAICSHAGHCTDGLAAVFKYGSEPWIDPDGAALEAIVATIRNCPSGALSYSVDGVEHRDQQREPAITVTRNGPYAVVGGVRLLGETWGMGASKEHYALCRCGQSKNKPFCDGSHWSAGFKDERN